MQLFWLVKNAEAEQYTSRQDSLNSAPELVRLVDEPSSRAALTTPATSTRRPRPDALAPNAVDETIHWLRLDELFEGSPWRRRDRRKTCQMDVEAVRYVLPLQRSRFFASKRGGMVQCSSSY